MQFSGLTIICAANARHRLEAAAYALAKGSSLACRNSNLSLMTRLKSTSQGQRVDFIRPMSVSSDTSTRSIQVLRTRQSLRLPFM
jgi:hypothetical protein